MTNIELINLTLDEIRRAVNIINVDKQDCSYCRCWNPQDQKIHVKIGNLDIELDSIRLELKDILKNILNYLIKEGMIGGVESAIMKVPCELIFERKNENDFEE